MEPATPYLVIDLARLQANIDRAVTWARERGLNLRPHVKTHKSPTIAQLQLKAGASGISVATVAEAEVFVGEGCDDVFIAYPLWADPSRRARLTALAERATITVGFDSLDGAQGLVGTGVQGLVEVDTGHHRSGVAPAQAGSLAVQAQRKGLEVVGVFTFPGHSYSPQTRRAAAADEAQGLGEARASMARSGIEPRVVSGGSTPSLAVTGEGLNEVRPGVYVFNDAQQWELGSCEPSDIALTCQASVVSHSGGRLVLDAGSKALGADRPAWASGYGRLLDYPQARIEILSEHHAVCVMGPDEELPTLGSHVRVVPNHVCNAVNLADEYLVISGDQQTSWPVTARGKNG